MISDNYVTGDNVYLRELQNFFFKVLGMMSVTHYGAIGDGRTDNYGPLQVAIDDANRRGLSYIYVPYGRFIYTGELINMDNITFVGNPKAHIVNIRTGVEIPIEQFGLQIKSIQNIYDLKETLILEDGVIPDLETGFYLTGEYQVYGINQQPENLIIDQHEMFYWDKDTTTLIGAFESAYLEDGIWIKLVDDHFVKKSGDTMTGDLELPNLKASNSLTVGNRRTSVTGEKSFTSGLSNEASGKYSHAEGRIVIASGEASHAEGYQTIASGKYSHAEGSGTTASGKYSHAEGYECVASEVSASIVTPSHAEGKGTTASGNGAHAEGMDTVASGYGSHAGGSNTIATRFCQFTIGHYNIEESGTPGTNESTTGILIVGNGSRTYNSETQETTTIRANSLKLTRDGDLYIAGTYYSNGADYAESVEWLDGNPNDEDRAGKFVVLVNNKMRIANSQDDQSLMGVVSAFPSVLGDSYDSYWHNKYVTDVYGRIQYHTIQVPAELDSEGNVIIEAHEEEVPMINPNYDPTREYIPRNQRKEYGSFAMLGKLIVEDDGTCEVGGYCFPNDSGIGTKKYEGFYVMERIDSTHVKIFIR